MIRQSTTTSDKQHTHTHNENSYHKYHQHLIIMLTDDDNNMKNITFFSGTRTHTCTHIYHNCGQTKKKMIQDGQSIFFCKS